MLTPAFTGPVLAFTGPVLVKANISPIANISVKANISIYQNQNLKIYLKLKFKNLISIIIRRFTRLLMLLPVITYYCI